MRRHDQDRRGRVAEHDVGNAAEDEAPDAATSVRRHHDEADVLIGCGLEDPCLRLAIDDAGDGTDAVRRERCGYGVERLLGSLFQGLARRIRWGIQRVHGTQQKE